MDVDVYLEDKSPKIGDKLKLLMDLELSFLHVLYL